MKSISNINNLCRYIAKRVLRFPESPFVLGIIGKILYRILHVKQNFKRVELSHYKRVLIIRLDVIGDVALTTPFLRELRRNIPKAWIVLVVDPLVYNMVEVCPYVDEVFSYACKGSKVLSSFQRYWRGIKLSYQHLWTRRFDLAILPRRDVDRYTGTFLAYLSGASTRVGFSEKLNNKKNSYNQRSNLFLTHKLFSCKPKHEVLINLDLLHFLGGDFQNDQMEIWLSQDDEQFCAQTLKISNFTPRDFLIGLAPGATQLKRMWPLSNFILLGKWMNEAYNARIIVLGGQNEETLGQKIAECLGDSVINIVGRTTLRQAASILNKCHLYIGNDSGLMHLSAASGIPVVEISCHPLNGSPYHPNSPKRFGPWGVPHRILQPKKAKPPCSESCISTDAHCILGITVEQVKMAVAELLSNNPPKNKHP